MKKKTLRMLNASEQELLRKTEPEALKGLDEEALLALHSRVRRARSKYATLYRRRSSAQVRADRSRATASASHRRTAVKAEVFEKALARVSRRLAKVAKASADQLREERLAAARAVKGKGKAKAKGKAKTKASSPTKKLSSAKAQQRTPARKRSSAQSRASTRRHQAARASR